VTEAFLLTVAGAAPELNRLPVSSHLMNLRMRWRFVGAIADSRGETPVAVRSVGAPGRMRNLTV